MRRDFRRGALSALAIVVTIAAAWVWSHEGHAPLPTRGVQVDVDRGVISLSAESARRLGVETAPVAVREIEERIAAPATVTVPWQRHAFVAARVPGRIVRIRVQAGDAVKAGQAVADLEPLELETGQRDLLDARNDVRLSRKLRDLVKPLTAQGTAAAKELREAEAKLAQDLGALEIAKARLAVIGVPGGDIERLLRDESPTILKSLPLTSPINGVVVHVDGTLGKIVEGPEHLMEIADATRPQLRISLLERDLARVRVGAAAEFLATRPGRPVHATIRFVERRLEAPSRLGVAWAEIESAESAGLGPGGSGSVRIVVASGKGLAVPATSIVDDGADRFVLVENAATSAGSEYRRKPVVVEATAGNWARIAGDVFAGDRVVTTGCHELAGLLAVGGVRATPALTARFDVRPLTMHAIDGTLDVDGTVELPPDRRAMASTQLAGTLQRILVDRGQSVRAGDVVAEIASPALQALQFELLKADLRIKALEPTIAGLRSTAELAERRPLLEAESQRDEARNRRDSARRSLVAVGLSDRDIDGILAQHRFLPALPLRAPIDGVIVQVRGVLGQSLRADDVVIEIHDPRSLLVRGIVSNLDVGQVRVGQTVRLRVGTDGFVGAGTLARISPTVDPEERSTSVWIDPAELPTNVLPGSLVRISILIGRSAEAVAVPRKAVVRDGSRAFVFVRSSSGIFERRTVDVGRSDDRWIEIRRGVEPGEAVAHRGAAELRTALASRR